MSRHITFASAFLAAGLIAGTAEAETNILFILDGSNSMWGQIDGTAKIDTAKSVLNDTLSGLSGDVVPGLMIYGHRRKDDCSDVQLVAPFGSGSVDSIRAAVSAISPRGKTPIADSLKAAGNAFAGREEENNNILLMSDGIETCGGDPCAVAGELVRRGINVRVHVVGFDVDAETRAQLQCIAEKGNGEYFDAKNASDFQSAVAKVQELAKAPEPEPEPVPTTTEYFRDDFNGAELANHWEVINPDPDAFIVEDGNLLVFSSTPADFAEGNIANLFRLNQPLPKGDWTATAKIRVDFQSLRDRVFFGLYDDEKNYLVNVLSLRFNANYDQHILFVSSDKALKGKITTSSTHVWTTEKGSGLAGVEQGQPYLVRLEKKGREYTGFIKLEGAQEPEWFALPAIRLLRSKANLAIAVFQAPGGGGEGALMVDWMKIEVTE